MKIKELKLNNFRNYKALNIEFSPNVNSLVGRNAQGKTNLLEARVFARARKRNLFVGSKRAAKSPLKQTMSLEIRLSK